MTAANSYIAIDVETTGLAPKRDKILEIAALYVAEGQIQDRFVTLIQPCRPIAPEITRLTGITDDLVREAPEVEDVIGELVKFCGELPLLGHNISFDYSFLQQAAVNAGLKLPANVLDTLGLCRSFMPAGEPKNLGGLCLVRHFPDGGPPGPGGRRQRSSPLPEAPGTVRNGAAGAVCPQAVGNSCKTGAACHKKAKRLLARFIKIS